MRNFSKAILVASAALCLNLSAFSQNVSFSVQNVTVKEAMEQLKKTSGYSFVFSSSDVDTSKKSIRIWSEFFYSGYYSANPSRAEWIGL